MRRWDNDALLATTKVSRVPLENTGLNDERYHLESLNANECKNAGIESAIRT